MWKWLVSVGMVTKMLFTKTKEREIETDVGEQTDSELISTSEIDFRRLLFTRKLQLLIV